MGRETEGERETEAEMGGGTRRGGELKRERESVCACVCFSSNCDKLCELVS